VCLVGAATIKTLEKYLEQVKILSFGPLTKYDVDSLAEVIKLRGIRPKFTEPAKVPTNPEKRPQCGYPP